MSRRRLPGSPQEAGVRVEALEKRVEGLDKQAQKLAARLADTLARVGSLAKWATATESEMGVVIGAGVELDRRVELLEKRAVTKLAEQAALVEMESPDFTKRVIEDLHPATVKTLLMVRETLLGLTGLPPVAFDAVQVLTDTLYGMTRRSK